MSKLRIDIRELTEHGVLTQQAIEAYLQGQLSDAQVLEFEKILAQDPFAQEALEGLQAAGISSEKLHQITVALNEKITEKSGIPEAAVMPIGSYFKYFAAAASLAFLIGLGVLMFNFFNNKTEAVAMDGTADVAGDSQVTTEAPVSATPAAAAVLADTVATVSITSDQLVQGVDDIKLEKEAPPAASAENKKAVPLSRDAEDLPVKKTESAVYKDATVKSVPAREEVAEAEGLAKYSNSDKRAMAPAAPAAAGDAAVMNEVSITERPNSKAIETNKTNATPSMDDAMRLFNANKYAEAADKFEAILKKDPDNSGALYFGGVSDYFNEKNTRSLDNFNKLLKRGQYVDGAKWYKASILLKKGRKGEALILFKELAAGSSIYKDRAAKKLTELK